MVSRIRFVVTLLLCSVFLPCTAGAMRNAVTFEVLGNAGIYSLNYERTLFSAGTGNDIGIRCGLSFLPFYFRNFRSILLAPVQLLWHTRPSSHGAEIALGITTRMLVDTSMQSAQVQVTPAPSFGYRYTMAGSGSLLKVSFTPLFFEGFRPWFGVSVGRTF